MDNWKITCPTYFRCKLFSLKNSGFICVHRLETKYLLERIQEMRGTCTYGFLEGKGEKNREDEEAIAEPKLDAVPRVLALLGRKYKNFLP